MGSLFLTFDEAATRLECSKRSIHNYIKRGYIRKSLQKGKVVLHREDIEQLANETGVNLPAFNRKNFFMLMARIQKLEEDMGLCRRILEIRDNPLRPSKEEALQLYAAASKALTVNYWTDEEMETWGSVFERLDEVALDRLSELLTSKNCYEVFYALCLNQMKAISQRDGFKTTLALQSLHKTLDEGRKRMRATILLWLEMGKGTLPESVLQKLETDKGALFKRLLSDKANKNPPKA